MKNLFVNILFLFLISGTAYYFVNFDRYYDSSLESVAVARSVRGSASVKSPYELFDSSIKRSDRIANGSIVKTLGNSSVEVYLINGAKVTILENSVVEISVGKDNRPSFSVQAGLVKSKDKNVEIKKTDILIKKEERSLNRSVDKVASSNPSASDPGNVEKIPQVNLALLNFLKTDASKLLGNDIKVNFSNSIDLEETEDAPKNDNRKIATPDLSFEKPEPLPIPEEKPKTVKLAVNIPSLAEEETGFLALTGNSSSISYSEVKQGTNVWVKSFITPHPVKLVIKASQGVRPFYFTDKKKNKRIYFEKENKFFTGEIPFQYLFTGETKKIASAIFKEVSLDVWVADNENENKIKKLPSIKYFVASVNELGGSRVYVTFSSIRGNHNRYFIENKFGYQKGLRNVYFLSSNAISEIWSSIKNIRQVAKVGSILWQKGENGIGIKGNEPYFMIENKDRRPLRRLMTLTRSDYGFIGNKSDYLGYLGDYQKVVGFIKNFKGKLNEEEKIYFTLEDSVIPIDIDLLLKDESVFNLLDSKYDAAFKRSGVIVNNNR